MHSFRTHKRYRAIDLLDFFMDGIMAEFSLIMELNGTRNAEILRAHMNFGLSCYIPSSYVSRDISGLTNMNISTPWL